MAPSAYEQLGVSATKTEVHQAVAQTDPGLFPGAFCRLGEDVLTGDPAWCAALHSDDAGTKVLVAYLLFRETGEARVFRGLAQDALVMNLDDLLCVGAVDNFLLSNTINRNSFYIPGAVLSELLAGYTAVCQRLHPYGITIVATGGETADMSDAVRTLLVGATLATRLPRTAVIDNSRIQAGDLIVGLSSTGKAVYEDSPNSGIGDNGLTLARHALLHHDYALRYPESFANEVAATLVYRGPFHLHDQPEELKPLGLTVGEALCSPTRTYAPIVRKVLRTVGVQVHGIIHNTGGGQTKCLRFGQKIAYVKDQLFDSPPLFSLIAQHGQVPWREMYQTFNMGHRMELMVEPAAAETVMQLSRDMGVEARIVGHCEAAPANRVLLHTPHGTFEYT